MYAYRTDVANPVHAQGTENERGEDEGEVATVLSNEDQKHAGTGLAYCGSYEDEEIVNLVHPATHDGAKGHAGHSLWKKPYAEIERIQSLDILHEE